jgi:hypothetical protein
MPRAQLPMIAATRNARSGNHGVIAEEATEIISSGKFHPARQEHASRIDKINDRQRAFSNAERESVF